MQVVQTAGAPPSRGSTMRAIMGSTKNSSPALTNIVTAYQAIMAIRCLVWDQLIKVFTRGAPSAAYGSERKVPILRKDCPVRESCKQGWQSGLKPLPFWYN